MLGNMACVAFQTQLSSIMEVLVKAAVAEISKLVDDNSAFLHLEISRKQSENEMLKRKLLAVENKNAQMQRVFGKEHHNEDDPQLRDICFHGSTTKIPKTRLGFQVRERVPNKVTYSN